MSERSRYIGYFDVVNRSHLNIEINQVLIAQKSFEQALQIATEELPEISHLVAFARENPHVVFLPSLEVEHPDPILSLSQVEAVATLFRYKEWAEQLDVYFDLIQTLLYNYSLYELVMDEEGGLLRWGKSKDEEKVPFYKRWLGPPWADGLHPYIKKIVQGKIITWWSRQDISQTPYDEPVGGSVLRETSLAEIKQQGNYQVALDLQEPCSLVLLRD